MWKEKVPCAALCRGYSHFGTSYCKNGYENLPDCPLLPAHAFLHTFQDIGGKVASATLLADTRWHTLKKEVIPANLTVNRYLLFNDRAAAILALFVPPKCACICCICIVAHDLALQKAGTTTPRLA